MIKVYCNGTRIRCLRQGELNVGMSGAPVEFDFSGEWDGLVKTAVFRCDGEKNQLVGADGITTVPHEILTTVGMDVEVGVYAVKEDGTTWPAPTTYCKIGEVGEGADPSGDESYPPTPDVVAQAVAAAGAALALAQEAKESADSSVKSVNGVKPDENGNVIVNGSGSGGISITAKNLLLTILRAAFYSSDQTSNIAALGVLLESGSSSGGGTGGGGSNSGGSAGGGGNTGGDTGGGGDAGGDTGGGDNGNEPTNSILAIDGDVYAVKRNTVLCITPGGNADVEADGDVLSVGSGVLVHKQTDTLTIY